MAEENYPLDITYLGFSNEYMVIDMIETYYMAGAKDKALELSKRFTDEIFKSLEFFLEASPCFFRLALSLTVLVKETKCPKRNLVSDRHINIIYGKSGFLFVFIIDL